MEHLQIPDYIKEDKELFAAYKDLLLSRFRYESEGMKMKIARAQSAFEQEGAEEVEDKNTSKVEEF